jgi:hypothetical protein
MTTQVKNTFGYVVGKVVNGQFRMKVTEKNYFHGVVDGWFLDEAVITKLKSCGAEEIWLQDKNTLTSFFVGFNEFLDRSETIKSKHGLLYILPDVGFDACEPKQKNWPIPYAE